MEYYNNTLCIESRWLIEERILGYDYYRQLNARNQIKVIRRACRNTPALVEFDSIPRRFKEKIIEKIGDPHKQATKSSLKDMIVEDAEARRFFREYVKDDGNRLPEEAQVEYVANAEILNALHSVVVNRSAARKAIGGKLTGLWPKLADAVATLDKTVFNHALPVNSRRLHDRYKQYIASPDSEYDRVGYESLIHRNWCNKNSEKINDEAKMWMLSRWTSMVDRIATEQQLFDEYNRMAVVQEWKQLRSVDAIHNFLYAPEVKGLWWGSRYGELKFKEKFGYQHKTILPTMRDSLWYSDGTKLNYYYQYRDAQGRFKIGTTQVYEVMDVFSECLLGYHISDSEDYVAQYNAYRMALETSQHKPYQITYDNQGGHKKLENGDFLGRLSHLAIKTKPYNGKSKTIESAFGRFQQQFLKRDWFFTGQNIQAKKDESKANMEFIMSNKANLPTLEQIHALYKQRRDDWNNAKHPNSDKSRIQLYRESSNPEAVKLELMDMVDLFWVLREKPVKVSAWGISFVEKNEKYDYMVMQSNGLPDLNWLVRNVDSKVRIKFDPQDFSVIYLYEETPQGLRFITAAEQKVEIHRGKQEQQDWEASWIKQVDMAFNSLRVEMQEKIKSIQEAHNQLPEQHGLISPAIKGVNSKKKKAKAAPADNFGRLQKAYSNAVVATDDEDFDENDLYRMI